MDLLIAVIPMVGAVLIGAISPGPSFVVVAQTAISVSRSAGVMAAVGMGFGALVFAGGALLGLQAVLANVPWIYLGLKLAGAAYLIYLAARLWKHAADPMPVEDVPDRVRGLPSSFAAGLLAQLSNPKTAIFYASIFTALLPASQSRSLVAVVLPLIFVAETGWYALLAVAFSSAAPRHHYVRSKIWIDRTAGGVMALLGVKLMSEAR
jgi:threonine/homoserine/homoserine lactone efflux protein